jgi:hypothetical protein
MMCVYQSGCLAGWLAGTLPWQAVQLWGLTACIVSVNTLRAPLFAGSCRDREAACEHHGVRRARRATPAAGLVRPRVRRRRAACRASRLPLHDRHRDGDAEGAAPSLQAAGHRPPLHPNAARPHQRVRIGKIDYLDEIDYRCATTTLLPYHSTTTSRTPWPGHARCAPSLLRVCGGAELGWAGLGSCLQGFSSTVVSSLMRPGWRPVRPGFSIYDVGGVLAKGTQLVPFVNDTDGDLAYLVVSHRRDGGACTDDDEEHHHHQPCLTSLCHPPVSLTVACGY